MTRVSVPATVVDVQARAGVPPPSTAPGAIATAVLRALVAPPAGNKSGAVGGHSSVAAREGGGLRLADDERDLLRPPLPPPRGAFPVRALRPDLVGGEWSRRSGSADLAGRMQTL